MMSFAGYEYGGKYKTDDNVILEIEVLKGSWGPNTKFTAAFVSKMLKDSNLNPDFSAGDLLRVWRKREKR